MNEDNCPYCNQYVGMNDYDDTIDYRKHAECLRVALATVSRKCE